MVDECGAMGNDWQGTNHSARRQTHPRPAVSTTNSTWTALGLDLSLHNKKLAVVSLVSGMAPHTLLSYIVDMHVLS